MAWRGVRAGAVAGALALVVLSGCGSESDSDRGRSTAATSTSNPPAGDVQPVVRVERLTSEERGERPYSYDVEYARLDGLPDAGVIRSINDVLLRGARAMADRFVTDLADRELNVDDPERRLSRLVVKSEATVLDRRLFSVRSIGDAFYGGAAHPSGSVEAWTFELGSGRRLTIADLFHNVTGAMRTLSEKSREQLRRDVPALAEEPLSESVVEGTAPREENFRAFALTPSALELTFEEGQLGGHWLGQPKVAFPYVELRALLRRPGPLDDR